MCRGHKEGGSTCLEATSSLADVGTRRQTICTELVGDAVTPTRIFDLRGAKGSLYGTNQMERETMNVTRHSWKTLGQLRDDHPCENGTDSGHTSGHVQPWASL